MPMDFASYLSSLNAGAGRMQGSSGARLSAIKGKRGTPAYRPVGAKPQPSPQAVPMKNPYIPPRRRPLPSPQSGQAPVAPVQPPGSNITPGVGPQPEQASMRSLRQLADWFDRNSFLDFNRYTVGIPLREKLDKQKARRLAQGNQGGNQQGQQGQPGQQGQTPAWWQRSPADVTELLRQLAVNAGQIGMPGGYVGAVQKPAFGTGGQPMIPQDMRTYGQAPNMGEATFFQQGINGGMAPIAAMSPLGVPAGWNPVGQPTSAPPSPAVGPNKPNAKPKPVVRPKPRPSAR